MASSLPCSLPTVFSTSSFKAHRRSCRLQLSAHPNKKIPPLFLARSADNRAEAAEEKELEKKVEAVDAAASLSAKEEKVKKEEALGLNVDVVAQMEAPVFKDSRWVGRTWDLAQFQAGGGIDWDAVINAEARRRKWLEDNPEASSNDEPVVFDTSIIPWWAWMKRYHLPEAELLNGRAAMLGFFMACFVDQLAGIGLVDQMGNFFCKTLLFISVAGVLLIRKNEDVEKLKKLIEETTFYDKQWQATWQDNQNNSKNK